MVKEKTETVETVEVQKELGVKLFKVEKVREKDDKGNKITCPTVAYVHLIVPCAYGDMVVGEHRILRGKDGSLFVARPSRSRQLFDSKGNKVSVQRFNTVRMAGVDDVSFDKALKDKILSSFGKG